MGVERARARMCASTIESVEGTRSGARPSVANAADWSAGSLPPGTPLGRSDLLECGLRPRRLAEQDRWQAMARRPFADRLGCPAKR